MRIWLVNQRKQMAPSIRMPFCFCSDVQMIAKNNRNVTEQKQSLHHSFEKTRRPETDSLSVVSPFSGQYGAKGARGRKDVKGQRGIT